MKTAVRKCFLNRQVRWLFLSLLCFGLTVSQIKADGSILQIPDSLVVPGPKISLLDLATVSDPKKTALLTELKKMDLGAAPQPGQERKFSRNYVEFLLKQHHLDNLLTLQMGSAVSVKTEGTLISGEELQKLMEAQLPPNSTNYIARRLEMPDLNGGIWLEKGEQRIDVKPLGKIPDWGPVVFGVSMYVNQVKKKTMNIRAEIFLTGLVYQAKRMIRPKEKITEADFSASEGEIRNKLQYYGGFPQGCRAVKRIGPGESLQWNAFQQIPPVTKGSIVSAVIRLHEVSIQVTAIAKQDGWLGDDIDLINSKSRQTFKARVTGGNLVEVKVE